MILSYGFTNTILRQSGPTCAYTTAFSFSKQTLRTLSIGSNPFNGAVSLARTGTCTGMGNNNNNNNGHNSMIFKERFGKHRSQSKLSPRQFGLCSSSRQPSSLFSAITPEQSESESLPITNENLPQALRTAFQERETDGIMDLAPSLIGMDGDDGELALTGEDIIMSALEATHGSKGQAAGIINAVIASCDQEGRMGNEDAPALAWDIYTTWEELAEELELYPDIVTFCVTYSAVLRVLDFDEDVDLDAYFFQDCADAVLERAQRYSKKQAGTKRRKMLNAISRRGSGSVGKKDEFRLTDHLEQMQESYGMDFDVLFEDENVVVLNKPSGMVCFHSRKTTDGKIGRKKKVRTSKKTRKKSKKDGTGTSDDDDMEETHKYSDISLEDALIDIGLTLSKLNPEALGIVHRIDRGTSGCIVIAKNDETHAKLVSSFFTRSAQKRYTALVPYEATGVSTELESSGVIEVEVNGRPAKSIYNIERTLGSSALQLDLETRTGRKHQVRIHCSKGLGRPIFLDPLYAEVDSKSIITRKGGSKHDGSNHALQIFDEFAENDGRRFFLHARSLRIEEFGIDVHAQLPRWWSPIMEDLEKLSDL